VIRLLARNRKRLGLTLLSMIGAAQLDPEVRTHPRISLALTIVAAGVTTAGAFGGDARQRARQGLPARRKALRKLEPADPWPDPPTLCGARRLRPGQRLRACVLEAGHDGDHQWTECDRV
jgi:hypothetical protein